MKLALLCASTIALLAGNALAADMPAYEPAPMVPVMSAPAASWTGFYVGAGVGYEWFDADLDFSDLGINPAAAPPAGAGITSDGAEYGVDSFVLRGTVGFDYQIGRVVVGAMADVDWTSGDDEQDIDLAVDADGDPATAPEDLTFPTSLESQWGASILGRAGFLATDRLLVYGLAGWSWKNIEFEYTDVTTGTDPAGEDADDETTSGDETLDGWTVGIGAEALVTDMISVKGEYRYTNFGDFEVDATDSSFVAVADLDSDQHQLLVGANVRFGGM